MARILLIDDQPESCEAVVEFLERAGHTVKQSGGGSERPERLPAIHPDLLVVDLRMPHMDGFAFLTELRQDPMGSRMPVILLTGVSDPELRWRASELGVERVFLKGDFDLIDLLKCVNKLAEPEEPAPAVLQHVIPTSSPTVPSA